MAVGPAGRVELQPERIEQFDLLFDFLERLTTFERVDAGVGADETVGPALAGFRRLLDRAGSRL